MTGNIINFSRLIERSRDFPSLEEWEKHDPKSYEMAAHYGILERHEIQRHMSPAEMSNIALEDVLRDLPKRTSPRQWRRTAPIFYWKCYHEDWFDLPEIRAHIKNAKPTYLSGVGRSPVRAHGKGVVSNEADDDLTNQQIRKKIQETGLLLDEKFIRSFPDQNALSAILKNEVTQGNLIKLSKDLYVKSYITSQNLDQMRQSIINSMIYELKWDIIPCCQTLAIEHGLTPRSDAGIGAETTGSQLTIKLKELPGGGNSVIRISRIKPKSYNLNQSREGRVLRALMGVDDERLPEAVARLIGRMKPVEVREVVILSSGASNAIRREIRKFMGSKAGL